MECLEAGDEAIELQARQWTSGMVGVRYIERDDPRAARALFRAAQPQALIRALDQVDVCSKEHHVGAVLRGHSSGRILPLESSSETAAVD